MLAGLGCCPAQIAGCGEKQARYMNSFEPLILLKEHAVLMLVKCESSNSVFCSFSALHACKFADK